MIKTIVFDLGDVILKVDKTGQFKKFATGSNKTVSYIKKYFENSSFRKAFERGELKPRQFYEKTAKELNLNMNFNDFKKTWCHIFTLNDDVEGLIKNLKGKFRLILLSNTDEMHFEYIKSKYRVVNVFDEWILSYEIGYRKPNPLIFLSALRKAKTLPFNCVFIDDIPEFVYVARLMGIRAFQYKNFEKLVGDLNKVKVLTKVL
ncbi:MAG: HAD family phosphatase [Nanoarchaeota archaeon]|nr:HAD family phosphatase [Nanoarchaeota archaeon]